MKKKMIPFLMGGLVCGLFSVLCACSNNSSVTVKFETNGGTPIEQVSFKNFDSICFSEITTTRENYVFKVWCLNEELTNPIFDLYFKKPQTDITLYADWASVYLEKSDKEVYVMDWDDSKGGTVEIPNTFNGKKVTGIGDDAFRGLEIEEVIIPESVDFIGENAFANSSIVEVVIPSGIKTIGDRAFYQCDNLVSVNFSKKSGFDYIGDLAFSETSIESIDFPSERRLGFRLFSDCRKLKKVNFASDTYPKNVSNVYLFDNCPEIEEVTGNFGVIDCYSAFKSTPWYRSFAEDDSIIYKNNIALCAVQSMCVAAIPEGIVEIAAGCFKNRALLDKITFPSTLKKIGDDAFFDTSLQEVELPNGFESIGNNAFPENVKFTSVPESLKNVGSNNFTDNSEIVSLPESLTSVGDNSFRGCSNLMALPSGLKLVGAGAFGNCVRIAELPNTMEDVGSGAFQNSKWWNKQPKGVVYYNKSVIGFIGDVTEGGTLSIREGTETIGKFVFKNGVFDQIIFPSTLKSIQTGAFQNVRVPKIILPEGLTSISDSAFCFAEVSEVYIPDSVERIEFYAFFDLGLQLDKDSSKILSTIRLPKFTKYVNAGAFNLWVKEVNVPDDFFDIKILEGQFFKILYLKEHNLKSVNYKMRFYLRYLMENFDRTIQFAKETV